MIYKLLSIFVLSLIPFSIHADSGLYQSIVRNPVIISDCELSDHSLISRVEKEIAESAPPLSPERRDIISWQAMTWSLQNSMKNDAEISDEEITDYYDQMKHHYVHGRTAYFEYIFAPATDSNAQEQKQRITELFNSFKGENITWSKLKIKALTQSMIVSPQRKVAIPGKLSPVLDEAVFSTEERTISEVLKTDKGYYLVYPNRQVPAKNQSLDEVREHIRELVQQRKLHEKRMELLNQLRDHFPLIHNQNTGYRIGDFEVTEAHLEEAGLPPVDLSNPQAMNQLEQFADIIRLYLHGKKTIGTEEKVYLLARDYLANNYRAQNYLEHVQSNADSSIDDWQVEYRENKEDYISEELRHIYSFEMPLDSSSPEKLVESQSEAKENLTRVREALRDGTSEQHAASIDERIRLIDLQMLPTGPRGALVDLSVEDLSAGDTTGVILQQQRAFVFYVSEIKPPRQLTFKEAESIIKENIEKGRGVEKRNRIICDLVEDLNNQSESP